MEEERIKRYYSQEYEIEIVKNTIIGRPDWRQEFRPKTRSYQKRSGDRRRKKRLWDWAPANGKRAAEKFSISRWTEVIKYRFIDTFAGYYPIQEMCRLFEASRSGYYCNLRRKDRLDRDLPLAELIRECQPKEKEFMVIAGFICDIVAGNRFPATPKRFFGPWENMAFSARCVEEKYYPCGKQ